MKSFLKNNIQLAKKWLPSRQEWRKYSLFEKLLFATPLVVWFSYQPNFYFNQIGGMNIELSLPLVFIAMLALAGLPQIFNQRRKLANRLTVWLTICFVIWRMVSVLWSEQPLRTIVTGGVEATLVVIFLGMLTSENLKTITPKLVRLFIFSSVFMSLVSVIQVVYGAWFDWGLCRGCLAAGFGFVRPSVFTIEPQFFGSLLIAPILITMQQCFSKKSSRWIISALLLQLLALYVTLSRGAIVAVFVGLVVLVAVQHETWRKSLMRTLFAAAAVLTAFAAGMLLHATMTQLNPRVNDGFYDSISKSVNQLTLGLVKLPQQSSPAPEREVQRQTSTEIGPRSTTPSDQSPKKATFNGYVARSTDERTGLSSLALQTWQKDTQAIWFGVGAGAAGQAIFTHTHKTTSAAEIVQNQYIEVLLESGIFGFSLFMLLMVGLLKKTARVRWLWAIIIGFFIQWIFFSGLPNALHVYLILALMFATIDRVYE